MKLIKMKTILTSLLLTFCFSSQALSYNKKMEIIDNYDARFLEIIEIICLNNFVFIAYKNGNAGGLTQFLDKDGKPMLCENYKK